MEIKEPKQISMRVNSNELKTASHYCLYARKSSESDERQALSIEAQVKEMLDMARRDGLNITDIRRESHSAKATGQRPVFNKMLEDIRTGVFDGIIAWAPDRLSRNAGDLGAIVDLIDQKKLIEIRTFGQKFADNPNEKFLLMILGAQGKLENDQKGVNVKRGLRARCEQGLWPASPPTGYLRHPSREKNCHMIQDPKRALTIKQMFEKVAYDNWIGRNVYRWLKNELDFKTVNNKHLSVSNVYTILKNHFYYGTFEYPKESGNWYKGAHEPIITKELFDKVQETLVGSFVRKTESKEFAFTRLMKCGKCGSGITAEEKFKKLKNGSVNRHVYYVCTKSRDINCKGTRINEKDLLRELIQVVDIMRLDDLGVRERIERELKRYNKFRTSVLGVKREKQEISDLDIRNYAKYILKEGTILDKRELLVNLENRLILENKE
ncbi:MAG: recombinase family protein, partial [Candidatus Spechtbacterales bacterium]|nr:recombinase family protein [Candidatus Spechtbacterales bacterium]